MQHSFHRGSLALDFAGTLASRASETVERLPDAPALAEWLVQASLRPAPVRVTAAEFRSAIRLREAIAAVGTALASGRIPVPHDVKTINAFAARLPAPRLDPRTGEALRPAPRTADALARIAADAIAVFGDARERLVRCNLPECGALLLSATSGVRRRWCSMERCGNVAKARAHRARRGS